jgi:hypothetical protein
MDASTITALVSAWQTGGISRDTLMDCLRKGEIIPDGRSNAEEKALAGEGFQFLKGGSEAALDNSPANTPPRTGGPIA